MEITISLSAADSAPRFTVGKSYFSVGYDMRGNYVVGKVRLESINEKDKNGNDCVIFTNGIRIIGKLRDLYHTREEAERHAKAPTTPSGMVGNFDLSNLDRLSRPRLIEVLQVVDPKFDVAGASYNDLQWRIAKRLKDGAKLPKILKDYFA